MGTLGRHWQQRCGEARPGATQKAGLRPRAAHSRQSALDRPSCAGTEHDALPQRPSEWQCLWQLAIGVMAAPFLA